MMNKIEEKKKKEIRTRRIITFDVFVRLSSH